MTESTSTNGIQYQEELVTTYMLEKIVFDNMKIDLQFTNFTW